jgi:hypothetical protein
MNMAEMRARYEQLVEQTENGRQISFYSIIVSILGEANTPLDAKDAIHVFELMSAEDTAKIFQAARYELERMVREG